MKKTERVKLDAFLGALMLPVLLLGGVSRVEAKGSSDASNAPLIVYTNSGSDGRAEWLMEEAKAAGFTVEVMQLGGGEIVNRMLAEKNNPVADLVYGLSPMYFEQLKREAVLAKWAPSWANKVDKTLIDPEGFYYPLVIAPVFLMYNSNVISPAQAPKDWTDLGTNLAFKGKYCVLQTAGSISQAILIGILQRYKDAGGTLGISGKGWEAVKQFVQNGIMAQTGMDVMGNVTNGSVPMAETYGGQYLTVANANPQVKFDLMVPAVGVPYVVEEVGIVKNSKNFDRAKAFLDWFGDAEFQAKWMIKWGTVPVQPDALKSAPPATAALMSKLHPQQMDWAYGSQMIGAWVEKIQLEYVK